MSILNLSFNNLITNLVCCTNHGYIIYTLNPNLEKKISNEMKGGIGLMKIFNKTNIAILVGGGETPFKSKDTLVLHDQSNKQDLIEIDMREPIKNALIIKDMLVSVLEKKICIFDWSGTLLDSKITYSNNKGICVVNGDIEKPIIATLGTKKGEVAIWCIKDDSYKTLVVHKSNIDVITISRDGKYIATASETGTVVRVFNIETLNLEYEFRRGSKTAKIFDLCFNKDSTILGCYSNNGTVHLFEIYNDINLTKNNQSMLSGLKGYLPEYFSSQWGFKQINIGNTSKAVACFDDMNNLHIVLYDGTYYKIFNNENKYEDIAQGNLHINNK